MARGGGEGNVPLSFSQVADMPRAKATRLATPSPYCWANLGREGLIR